MRAREKAHGTTEKDFTVDKNCIPGTTDGY